MVEGFEKVSLEEIIFSQTTEASVKKLFIKTSLLVTCQVSMLQKSLRPLEPT